MSSSIEVAPEEWPSAGRPVAGSVRARATGPRTIIEPLRGWNLGGLDEIWRYRELLFFLAWRDVKVRYKQTVLGVVWAVLQPLATMTVFALFLGPVVGGRSDGTPYSLYVFAGLLPWTFLSGAINAAAQSVVGSQNLITKVYFPRLIIPLAAVGASLIDFAIAFVLLLGMMLGYRVIPGWGLLLVQLVILALVVAAVGVGTLLAALTVAYRDFRYVVPFMVQLWMFATPIIYLQASAIGPRLRAVLLLNPAYGLIAGFRRATLGGPVEWPAVIVSGTVGVFLLLAGVLYFRQVERRFADII